MKKFKNYEKTIFIIRYFFSVVAFSQETQLKIKSYKFTTEHQKLSDVAEVNSYGKIVLYDDFIYIKVGDKVEDIIYPLEEGKQEWVSGLDTFTFRATSENGDKNLMIRFVEDNIIMIIFSNRSVLTILYEK